MRTDIVQFERDLIKGLSNGVDSRRLMAQLSPHHFETIQLRQIFQVIALYYENYNEVPPIDILVNELRKVGNINIDELGKMIAFLTKQEVIPAVRFKYAIDEVEKAYLDRSLRIAMKAALIQLDKGNPKKAEDILLKDTINLASSNREVRVVDYVLGFEDRKKALLQKVENPELIKLECIETGISKLDFELDGGLRKGELGLILAPPEGGKSIALQDFTVTAALNGFKTALITIEMTPEQTAYRLDSRLTQIRYRTFRRATINPEEVAVWDNKIKHLKENMIKIIGVPEGCSCRLIESELARIAGSFRPDLICIDYVGIMAPNEGNFGTSMDWKYVGTIVRNVKSLALKMHIPVWTASQLLVGVKEKAEVSFVDVGLARQQLAAHADVCIAIIQTSQMRAMDVTKLQLVKVREGSENRFLEIASDYDRIKLERQAVQ